MAVDAQAHPDNDGTTERAFPFSAVVGSEDMALALILTTVSPAVGGVLVRGEKGTAKTTMVRALAHVLPPLTVVVGCRFGCDPADPDPHCPDGPHRAEAVGPQGADAVGPQGADAVGPQGADAVGPQGADAVGGRPAGTRRPARLVELPVGATEDRVIGSLDLQQALGAGQVVYEPGLLAAAHRGILYVDEVNLLHDHLVDLLLDAAATGRSTVEREGVSVAHASKMVLIGTMNPEEGELRPQLLDRFGLTVEIAAPRDPALRAEVVRRRMAFDAAPDVLVTAYAAREAALRERIVTARALLPRVELSDARLLLIAEVCAAFEVDGMRADIVTARAAAAHAAWDGRTSVTRADIRAAARLALPHRRRRNPFDAPGLDEELLDRLLGEDDPEPEPDSADSGGEGGDGPGGEGGDGPGGEGPEDGSAPGGSEGTEGSTTPPPEGSSGPGPDPGAADRSPEDPQPAQSTRDQVPADAPETPATAGSGALPTILATAAAPYRTRLLTATGVGTGESGRRSRALTPTGRTVGSTPAHGERGALHLSATIRAGAPHQAARGRTESGRLQLARADLRLAVTEGRESNLVLLVVDASGSMAARRRMETVKTAAMSLLLDAYQRRDKVGLVTFRGATASLVLPPTSSVEVAARRLDEVPSGGRTPLAEGLLCALETLRLERLRDPRRRPLLVLVTDGRATHGPDAVARSRMAADLLRASGVSCVVVDCETGTFSLGLAAVLSTHLGAEYVRVGELGVDQLLGAVRPHRPRSPGSGDLDHRDGGRTARISEKRAA